MPMFQDHLEEEASQAPPPPPNANPNNKPSRPIAIPSSDNLLARKVSEESVRTDLCEGPIPDSPVPRTPERDMANACSDRAELIERLKRGESPTWVPNRHLESLFQRGGPLSPTRSPRPSSKGSPTLLPPADITPEKDAPKRADQAELEAAEQLQNGLDIERPRSALHSGDFTLPGTPSERTIHAQESSLSSAPKPFPANNDPWLSTSPPRHFTPFAFDRRTAFTPRSEETRSALSSLSSSLSSSFVYKPPTSPLVQSESNEDLELSLPLNNIDLTPKSVRRHIVTHHSPSPSFHLSQQRHVSGLRRDAAFPYQAHQPRRSLTSTPNFSPATSAPQTPSLRSRRPSLSTENSPLQHASMVGSYEESILRGRMSTTPSKPLDFMAQIGVLGLGKCKASLRCPAHVTLPFSAVFYSYSNTPHGRSKAEDGPSPYVGQVDLENGLPNLEEDLRARRKQQSRNSARRAREDEMEMDGVPQNTSDRESSKTTRPKRRSGSPRAPPGGAYRIPEKGQLQIIIKNQNKTAVKLFLIPYDLAGMEPGTKTFIRQRSYSAGPIIDSVPEIKDSVPSDRPILRYLIHLHICCPSKGRFYLYKNIRVVFANRVPDGKEKLRNELTFPEPRFTPYKPIRVMHPPTSQTTGPGAMLAVEKAYRRRSSGWSFGNHNPGFDPFDALSPPVPSTSSSKRMSYHDSSSPFQAVGSNAPVEACPLGLIRASDGDYASESTASHPSRPATKDSNATTESGLSMSGPSAAAAGSWEDVASRYNKLSKGDLGYGGNMFASSGLGSGASPGGVAEGLLSQRLRSLGVQPQEQGSGSPGEELGDSTRMQD
ncbi:uncharacterized protein E0L32_004917 [Thyridium curvatum]|uniref:Atos-like conserved domain-containing protein n=1 Tax=Thyridium curvatum TaxID=1093900 RepID=A0A507B5P7_9PEZI|nr:uncharacterized protein E0L32_004917 [Thyridium curvatum]TPX15087.1 hypothetical protein E0L32_004917 [Thyridium curvatum]